MKAANYAAIVVCLLVTSGRAGAFGSQQDAAPSTPPVTKQTETPGETKVSPEKTAGKPKPRAITDLSGFDLTDSEKLKQQPMVLGATRGFEGSGELPQALAPKLAKVYSTEPTFFWRYTGKPGKTTFVLKNAGGAELYQAGVKGSQFQYKGQPPLVPGQTYYWSVEVQPEGEPAQVSVPVGFVVVGGAERERIASTLAASAYSDSYKNALSRARAFRDVRAWYDTVAAYSDLIALHPNTAELYEERGTIYAQFAATRPLAEEDFRRADNLANAKPAEPN